MDFEKRNSKACKHTASGSLTGPCTLRGHRLGIVNDTVYYVVLRAEEKVPPLGKKTPADDL